MRSTRLVFVEGIIGSGKTTTARRLTEALMGQGVAASLVPEGHPRLRIAGQLAHPFEPWRDVTPGAYIDRWVDTWRLFAVDPARDTGVSVVDGLLFHGNLTDLFLMDVDDGLLALAVDAVASAVEPIAPCIVYLRPRSVAHSLEDAAQARGADWVRYQVEWKLASPYARARALEGTSGLVQLYEAFRARCDDILASLAAPKTVMTDDVDWSERERAISAFLGL